MISQMIYSYICDFYFLKELVIFIEMQWNISRKKKKKKAFFNGLQYLHSVSKLKFGNQSSHQSENSFTHAIKLSQEI